MAKTYTYAVARIRALEAKMLTPLHVNRMIEAPDLERAFFVLSETSYTDHISGSVRPFAFEEIVEREVLRTHVFLSRVAGDDEALMVLWRRYDYGNAKALVRASVLKGGDSVVTLSDFGVVDKEALSSYILRGEGMLPSWLERPVNDAIITFKEEKNPKLADRTLDTAYIQDLMDSGNGLLIKIGRLMKESAYPFDLEGDGRIVDVLKAVKRRSFGIEPIITFWLAKALEAKTISQILIGKKHHMSINRIKGGIRETYA